MKICDGFILKDIAGCKMVIATGDKAAKYNGMITLNDTGAFIWERLEKGTEIPEIVDGLLSEYSTDRVTAENAVTQFVEKLKKAGMIEE